MELRLLAGYETRRNVGRQMRCVEARRVLRKDLFLQIVSEIFNKVGRPR